MENKKTFILRRRVVRAVILLLIPTSIFFAWVTHMAARQIQDQIGRANRSSLQLYANTLEEEIIRTEKFLNYLVYEDKDFYEFTSGDSFMSFSVYRETIEDLLEEGIKNNADLTALVVCSPGTEDVYIKFNSILLYADIEPEIRKMVSRKMDAGEMNLGWYMAKGQEHHYLCRMVEQNGCYVICFYNLSQVITNASIFYEQKGDLVLFDGKEILANSQFLEDRELALDYNFEGDYYFTGRGCEYIVVQEPLVNFKIALIEPYSSMNSSIRLLYLSPFLYIVVALLALTFVLFYLRNMLFLPLSHMVHVMEQIQTGNLDVRIEEQKSEELIQVQQTFNAMVTELVSSRIRHYEQKLENERIRLNSLKMQIRPHFYLNCLKGIFGLAQSGKNARIQDAVLYLSRHLRYVMNIDTDVIPLEQELEMCENYIRLQEECECGSPQIHIAMEPGAAMVMVPPVSLLTLVENCVKHATPQTGELKVQIRVRMLEADGQDWADIMLCDNGPGFPAKILEGFAGNQLRQSSIGLRNVIQRMELLYGERCMFRFFNDNGARVEIMLAMQESGEEGDG